MELVQIVPALPPALNGVGDYATLLAGELRAAHGVKSRFAVGDPAWRGSGGGDAETVRARSAGELERLLPDGAGNVLLHYVGYGYATRGCPFWLADGLERWKRREARGRLIVLFHETYATGPVWSSAFWTSPAQQSIAKRLARLADARQMTTTVAADELRAVLREPLSGLRIVPVFSNLGEPAGLTPLAQRRRQMIIFGSRSWRAEAYTRDLPDLCDVCRRLEIERIIDIGAPCGVDPNAVKLPVPVVATGPLSAAEASARFAESFAGFFNYPVPFLAKSGIFAAYCAHRLLPVTWARNRGPNGDGLVANTHFLAAPGAAPHDNDAIAAAAHTWYAGHRLAVHAEGIYQQMQPSAP